MLPGARRVPRKLFKPIIERGRYSNTPHFSLRAAQGEGELARVAVSVSKKVAKKAVLRNKIRRRTYAAVGGLLPSISPGLYLVSAKTGAGEAKGEVLKKELKELFSVFLIK